MTNYKLILSTVAASMIFTGCVTMDQKKATLDEKHSEAYNIARAGGLVTGIKDSETPRNLNQSMTDSEVYQSLSAINGLISPPVGLTGFQSFSASVLSGLFTPASHGARSSVIAWMPYSMAKDSKEAQRLLVAKLGNALSASLKEMNLKFSNTAYDQDSTVFFIEDDSLNCRPLDEGIPKACMITIYVNEPSLATKPSYISGEEDRVWQFNSSHGTYYNKLSFSVNRKSTLNMSSIRQSVAQKTDSWVYHYIATNDTYIDYSKSNKIKLPMIVSLGKPLFFFK